MKILVDLRKLSQNPSGIGIYIYNFVKGLMKYKELDIFGVTDVLLSDEIIELNNKGLKIISYNRKVDKNIEVFKYFDFIDNVIKRENPEIFWEPNQIVSKNLKKNNPKIKVMITIHDIFPITTPEYYSLKYRLYFKYFLKKSINNCDYIIYVSNFTKNQTNQYFKESLNKKDFVSYNIVDKPKYRFRFDDGNYFLYIGNIEKRKGVHVLLESYKKYIDDGGDKLLKIAGSIRDKKIENRMNDLIEKYPNKIEYLGYINDEIKWKLLYKCSAFIFPSYAEGFGIPPVEALIIGKPVILSNLDVFKEICGLNNNYFSLNNDLIDTYKNLELKMKDFFNLEYKGVIKLEKKYELEYLSDKFKSFIWRKQI
ncbi:glycosyltransferase family 4 protein [Clostridium sp.]|jgi:glycosyltransferase involved in cell wall biosynthesis|nr:glycosyltransferase family 1 protein [Clostridium sp.]MCI1714266.1 glycosyltransferase family 4 protein [Clostridium sp.]MCI1798528.1 glycosyltransferase family 4 protein [Clostridium sp.]MCI1812741.1 glycosyltransferase family 4 protein [Clostridium sp.]MCI1869337.1 glycosyltransferase family 4 protein [Clostridium sp.]MCI2202032.1 glycosyltransferase family 4 protein [Clostridium sp.]